MSLPPLTPMHADDQLSTANLARLEKLSTEALIETLQPDKKDSLKARKDGMILDGHHRIYLLRIRGIDVDSLPREIWCARKTDLERPMALRAIFVIPGGVKQGAFIGQGLFA